MASAAVDTDNERNARIGRQAIFDRSLAVYGYELLYRGPMPPDGSRPCGNLATSQTILDAFMELGIERLVADRHVFINLTRAFITGLPHLPFAPERVVLEILEDIEVDEELLHGAERLRKRGYTLAIDDYRMEPRWDPLIPSVRILKVEIDADTLARLPRCMRQLRASGALLLAEKVETREQYRLLHDLGFDLFQGFFFARPEIVEFRQLSNNQAVILTLISRIQDPEVSLHEIVALIAQDPALSFKVLRYVNSAASGRHREVASIQDAVALVGLNRIRAWATLLAMSSIQGKPLELCNIAMVRANVCERLSGDCGRGRPPEAYTVGLLSVLESLLDQSMESILDELVLPATVADALRTQAGTYGAMLRCALALEQCAEVPDAVVAELGASADRLSEIYLDSSAAAFESLAQLTTRH